LPWATTSRWLWRRRKWKKTAWWSCASTSWPGATTSSASWVPATTPTATVPPRFPPCLPPL